VGIRFGEYLKQARLDAKFTQLEAAAKISQLGRRASQGLIAQYESGKITPDPAMMGLLTEVYGLEYMMAVLQLVRDKYLPEGESGLPAEQLRLWEASLKRFPEISGVRGLEEAQIRAKATFVREMEVLDVSGIAQWERTFPNLEELWVVAPNFLDDKNAEIRAAVASNLKRHVYYRHYVRKADIEKNGRWTLLKRSLARFDSGLDERTIEDQMSAVAIGEDDLTWNNTDLIIANPRSKDAVGLSSVRRNHQTIYAIRIDTADLDTMISRLLAYTTEVTKGNLFHDSRLGRNK
jgi:transcriptional regulator with XRE-family HTH domain